MKTSHHKRNTVTIDQLTPGKSWHSN